MELEVVINIKSWTRTRETFGAGSCVQDMGLDTSKKMGHTNSETSKATPPSPSPSPSPQPQPQSPSPHSFEGRALQRKVVGETTAETVNLLSASIENCCSDAVQIDLLRSNLAGIKPVSDFTPFQYHVLAVDDSHFDRRVVEKLLKISSYKVTSVSSALKALEVLGLSENCSSPIKNLDINLIITDYCMPEMTGYDLLKRVKAQSSPWRDIPVVIMSSENDSNRIRSCLAEGAEEFIIKPVRLADVKRLRGHIGQSLSSISSGTADSSGSTSGKRKHSESHDTVEVTSSERRPRLKEVFVA